MPKGGLPTDGGNTLRGGLQDGGNNTRPCNGGNQTRFSGKVNEIYGFDWQEGRNCGDLFLYETAKTITATKPGAVCIGLDCYNQILTGGGGKDIDKCKE